MGNQDSNFGSAMYLIELHTELLTFAAYKDEYHYKMATVTCSSVGSNVDRISIFRIFFVFREKWVIFSRFSRKI